MTVRYVMSAPSPEILEDLGLPEVGFVGRSNVGKSSLIGALLKRPRLVRTSRTPGRTQALNLFVDRHNSYVDLPGYGYAKLSKTERARMEKMVRQYVTHRACLRGIVQVLDARREEVSELDREMAQLVLESQRPLLLVISKCDLVPKNKRLGRMRLIESNLGVPPGTTVMCSAKTNDGVGELRARLEELSQ